MVKLFLVEDEIVMREGIKRQINWEKEDIEFVGEASDGELAWPMILETKPDILLTDIKMPFMDGLELSALVRKELPDTAIIILSGYDEFVYAQQAVSLGVTDYLLKPLPPGKLLECIRRVQEKIETERSQTDSAWSEELAREQKDAEKNLLFRALVTNDRPLTEILAMADHLGIHISARYYCVMLMSVHGAGNAMPGPELGGDLARIPEQVEGWFFFDRNENGYALIGTANSGEDLIRSRDDLLGRLKGRLEEETDHTWFIGVGQTVNRISDIEKAYYSANKAFSWRFIGGLNRIAYTNEKGVVEADLQGGQGSAGVFVLRGSSAAPLKSNDPGTASLTSNDLSTASLASNDLSTASLASNDLAAASHASNDPSAASLDVKDAVSDDHSRKMLENFLKTGTYEEAEPFMEGVFASIGEKNLGSYLFLTYLSMDLYFSMVRYLKELGRRVDEIDETCGDINTLLKSQVTVDQARDYLTRYLKELILKRDHNAKKRYGRILAEAVAYIDENFEREDISLNRVAQTIGMSPNHFSSIFSQEMGETFIEYLIGRRMERAKELLRTTQMRSSEIAYQVGYRDPHYFSSTFKKMQGMTPREYRMSCQEQGSAAK